MHGRNWVIDFIQGVCIPLIDMQDYVTIPGNGFTFDSGEGVCKHESTGAINDYHHEFYIADLGLDLVKNDIPLILPVDAVFIHND